MLQFRSASVSLARLSIAYQERNLCLKAAGWANVISQTSNRSVNDWLRARTSEVCRRFKFLQRAKRSGAVDIGKGIFCFGFLGIEYLGTTRLSYRK